MYKCAYARHSRLQIVKLECSSDLDVVAGGTSLPGSGGTSTLLVSANPMPAAPGAATSDITLGVQTYAYTSGERAAVAWMRLASENQKLLRLACKPAAYSPGRNPRFCVECAAPPCDFAYAVNGAATQTVRGSVTGQRDFFVSEAALRADLMQGNTIQLWAPSFVNPFTGEPSFNTGGTPGLQYTWRAAVGPPPETDCSLSANFHTDAHTSPKLSCIVNGATTSPKHIALQVQRTHTPHGGSAACAQSRC